MSSVLAGSQQVGNQAVESLLSGSYQSVKQGAEKSTYRFSDGAIFYGLKRTLLGKGGTAHVKIAEDEKGGRWARRICKLQTPQAIQAFEKAVTLYQRLQGCSGIIPCTHSLKYEGGSGQKKGVMIHPLATKSLRDLVIRNKITRDNKHSFAKQLFEGLVAIYELDEGGAHGDIKFENILIDEKEKLYIIDFDYYRSPQEKGRIMGGTLMWLAPEFFDQQSGLEQEDVIHTKKLDSWSAGLVLYYIFNTKDKSSFPWIISGEQVSGEQVNKPSQDQVDQRLQHNLDTGNLSEQEHHLLLMMLQEDPKSRWTIPQAWSYFQENILKVPVVG